MTIESYKLEIIRKLLMINDIEVLKRVSEVIERDKVKRYDARTMSFEQWNEQFDDDLDLDEYLPEYGMTVREYRQMIYERERSLDDEYLTDEEFQQLLDKKFKEWEEE